MNEFKRRIDEAVEKYSKDIIEFNDVLSRNGELGYKEFKTKKLIIEELKKHDISINNEYIETGFDVCIGSGAPYIGLIAELDAMPTKDHPFASFENAAHSCGHNSQVAIMTYALIIINEIFDKKGTIKLFFSPGEEYTDLDYRRSLIKDNKIKYIGGKQNMLDLGVFDGIDLLIHLHASNNSYAYTSNSSLAGFVYKKIIFKGKASHAGVLPFEGINALNEFTLFNSAIGMIRESIKDNTMTRIHGIVSKGGDAINSVPDEVIYECYIRSLDADELDKTSKKVDAVATHSALALGGEAIIINDNGYKPFTPNPVLSKVIYNNMLNFVSEDMILEDEKSIAGGDVGDVSNIFPMTQFGFSGFTGLFHGKDFMLKDTNRGLIEPCKIVLYSVYDLLENEELVKKIRSY